MRVFKLRLPKNKIFPKRKKSTSGIRKFDFLWLLTTQPQKTFSSEDILNEIMASGLMIHEKKFIAILTQNICKKTGVQILQKTKSMNDQSKNKFLDNKIDFL